jgi:hypothetical protein
MQDLRDSFRKRREDSAGFRKVTVSAVGQDAEEIEQKQIWS